jgi:hypothetical protein
LDLACRLLDRVIDFRAMVRRHSAVIDAHDRTVRVAVVRRMTTDHPVIRRPRSVTLTDVTYPDEPLELGATRAHPLGAPAYPAGQLPEQSQPIPPYGPPPKRRRLGLIIGLAIAGALVLAGVGLAAVYVGVDRGALPGTPGSFNVTGSLTINGGDCDSIGYSDLHDGTEVTLVDERGTVLAVADLAQTATCSFDFSFDKVPVGRQFYGVTISHRGTLHYTEAQLRQGIELSIG